MYLKRLELQGYKSFARKTEFVFEHGITAIVGPNGSGKSNIADAVRWALGETRMSQLRAKITDDLIFAGSDSRARLGMAQVSMTLDNSDGALPIDYSEVTIERRAYRDGQNEYLINGTKVRLRDIVELLGASGLTRDAYTVIGQGLVDTVLSLRPQDRRTLIDVAAGVRPLQDKRDRALSQLEETRDNLTRVRDIIAEIKPRLRRLEKQAERAREGTQIAEQLAETLKTWYGYQWHTERTALREARSKAQAARRELEQRRQTANELEARIESRRDREEAEGDALHDLREQRAEVRGRYEVVRRELAVVQERVSLLEGRQEEFREEIAELQIQRNHQQHQLQDTETELIRLNDQLTTMEEQVESIHHRQAAVRQQRAKYESALESAQREAFELSAAITDTRNRLRTLSERERELVQERTTQRDAVRELAAQVETHRQTLQRAQQRAEKQEQTLQELRRDQEQCQAEFDAASSRADALRDRIEKARRQLERLHARREALAEMRRNRNAAGAQALLRARGELAGIVQGIPSLIRVPAEYEAAIEAALGPDLHAVVVRSWDDAQEAVTWLQSNDAGRATVLVLETPGETEAPQPIKGPGIIGVAADLVDCDPDYTSVVKRLLGQTVVVESLTTVQRMRGKSITFVTLDGTVVRPSGQITGGSKQSSVLRQERLWRELPAQIQSTETQVNRLEKERAEIQASVEALNSQQAKLERRGNQLEAARTEAQAAVDQSQRDIEVLDREIDWRRNVMEQRSQELDTVRSQISELKSRLGEVQERHKVVQARIEALEAKLEDLGIEALREEGAETEKQRVLLQRDRQSLQAQQKDAHTALRRVEQQIESRQARLQALSAETRELRVRIDSATVKEDRLREKLDALDNEIAPVEDLLRSLRREGRDLEREATHARERVRQAEATVSEASLELQRREDRLTALRDRIADDLELAAVGEELPRQLMLALEGEVEELPIVTEIPDGLERRVKRLRRQLRQVGSASPEIITEYEETKARYDFLTSQASDLEEAAADLRAVAAELTQVMTERFTETFEEVRDAFEKYFQQLFGGGEARLTLTEEETDTGSEPPDPGLEVVARPPGKRSSSLALLSGGERALTAVALLFSLLEVSPTPFCVFDEVDAMLDEANIGRFRSVLETLSEETQFVIITHNRGTIQAADTVYGISMGDEGVSQAISLKVDELAPVPA